MPTYRVQIQTSAMPHPAWIEAHGNWPETTHDLSFAMYGMLTYGTRCLDFFNTAKVSVALRVVELETNCVVASVQMPNPRMLV